jgi:hypothetical protein
MGLDMYLTAHHYLPQTDVKVLNTIKKLCPAMPGTPSAVVFDVCYWRKANAIHQWFVDHIQGGEDDCKDYPVSISTLRTLVDVCEQVRGDGALAPSLLPTYAGFFFGSLEYGEHYEAYLDHTITTLKPLLTLKNPPWLTYRSSW